MEEEWRVIDSTSYEVSNLGNVRNKHHQLLTLHLYKGYLGASLYTGKPSRSKVYRVNRLVAKAFIANPENKPEAHHKDGIKTNNRVDNLKWFTKSENIQDAYDEGLKEMPKGVKSSSSLPFFTYLKGIESFHGSTYEAVVTLGLNQSVIFNHLARSGYSKSKVYTHKASGIEFSYESFADKGKTSEFI